MLAEFKAFIMKGNLIELAVAFVLAAAFGVLVASFVDDIVMQIVAAIFGEPDFAAIGFDINGSTIRVGAFLNALVSFVIVAFVLFLIVKAYNRMQKAKEATAGPSETDLLVEIRDLLAKR